MPIRSGFLAALGATGRVAAAFSAGRGVLAAAAVARGGGFAGFAARTAGVKHQPDGADRAENHHFHF
jgi:hypothetical protein